MLHLYALLYRLKEVGSAPYTCTVEGDISEAHLAVLPSGVNSDRIRFVQVRC